MNQPKTPGAMVLPDRIDKHDPWGPGWNSCLDEIAKLNPAEQTPAAGGEPEIVGYRDKDGRCVTNGGTGRYTDPLVTLSDHRAKVAPLLTELEAVKFNLDKTDKLYLAAVGRISELEAQQGEAVAYVLHKNGEVDWDQETVISNTGGDEQDERWKWEPVFRQHRPGAAKLEMADVVRAHMEIPQCPVLTSNQCHSLAVKLNAVLSK